MNKISIKLYKIIDFIYCKIVNINKFNKFYFEIKAIINEDYDKFNETTLIKYAIIRKKFYYKIFL